MVEHGLYTIKKEFLELIKQLGGSCDFNEGYKRPTYCCIKDNKIDGLYWAIPTSDLSHRSSEQIAYIDFCMEQPHTDLRSCYYHIAKTTKESVYKISSCFPLIDKYIDHEYTTHGKHVIMKAKHDIEEIERKFRKILGFEFKRNNYFDQHITNIMKHLVNELEIIKTQNEVALTSE